MKNLKIKIGLFSLLVAFAASVLLTSCEREAINLDMDNSSEHLHSPETANEINHDYKKVIVFDENNAKKNEVKAIIRLSSDNEEVLSLFTDKNTRVEKNESVLEELNSDKRSSSEHSADCETHQVAEYDSFDKHLKIEVILDSKLDEKSGYTLAFGDELVSKFEGQNISTQINFLNLNTEKVTSGGLEVSGWWDSGDWINLPWWAEYEALNTKSAVFIGNGTNTKVTTYHSHSSGSSSHVFSNKYFRYCHYTYDCRSNHTLTTYKVQYGLVTKIHVYTNCNGRC